jgi:hypothetical protein
MAKGQKRSNREAKKPKQPKSDKKAAVSLPLLVERGAVGSRDAGHSARGRK